MVPPALPAVWGAPVRFYLRPSCRIHHQRLGHWRMLSDFSSASNALHAARSAEDKASRFYLPYHASPDTLTSKEDELRRHGKLFYYGWSSHSEALRQWCTKPHENGHIDSSRFCTRNLVLSLLREEKKVKLVLAEDSSSTFGKSQREVFEILSRLLPEKIEGIYSFEDAMRSSSPLTSPTSSPKWNGRDVIAKMSDELMHWLMTSKREEREEREKAIGINESISNRGDDHIMSSRGTSLGYEDEVGGRENIRVMSMNLWHGAETTGSKPSDVAKLIETTRAEIVGLQETYSLPLSYAHADLQRRTDNTPFILSALPEGWNMLQQGYPHPHRSCYHPSAILTRLPILEILPKNWGVVLESKGGRPLLFFNVHLPSVPYEPFHLLDIPYEGLPSIKGEADAIASAESTREAYVRDVISCMKETKDKYLARKPLVIVTGDFNEPSHLDWNVMHSIAGYCPHPVRWPVSDALQRADLVDTYRTHNGPSYRDPGFSWCTQTDELSEADHHDRIDMIYVGGESSWKILDSQLIQEEKAISDHRGVLSTLEILRVQ
ncbi:endonuclease/exonuclease/phosphatase [Planoprotostelium fungivorum]|uniref:Endonuclease/exonuclease/phosphatase n=1 Tax=Planoprotostelium fungivorum TaxID=1890364 RepID=A0A2P6NUY3_9EUKA|nr:endonuclease/exonuclease/phosphatase [Planoprotostelium fungivorum]